MSKSVLCEEKDNICLITLNEEDTRNAISPDIINELVSICLLYTSPSPRD